MEFGEDLPYRNTLLAPYAFLFFLPAASLAGLAGLKPAVVLLGFFLVMAVISGGFLWSYLGWSVATRGSSRFSVLALPAYLLAVLLWPAESRLKLEHFFMVMILPYLLHRASEVEGGGWHRGRSLIPSALAASVLLLKPQYTLVWIAVEVYLLIRTRRLSLLFSAGNYTIFGVLSAYYAGYAYYVHDKIELMAASLDMYSEYRRMRAGLEGGGGLYLFLHRKLALFFAGAIAVFVLGRFRLRRDGLEAVLGVAVLAALAMVLLKGDFFDSHFYPAVGAGLLLTAAGLAAALDRRERWRGRLPRLLTAGLSIAVFLMAGYRGIVWHQNMRATHDQASLLATEMSSRPGSRTYASLDDCACLEAAAIAGFVRVTRAAYDIVELQAARVGAGKGSPEDVVLVRSIVELIVEDIANHRPAVLIVPEPGHWSGTWPTIQRMILEDARLVRLLENYEGHRIGSTNQRILFRRPGV